MDVPFDRNCIDTVHYISYCSAQWNDVHTQGAVTSQKRPLPMGQGINKLGYHPLSNITHGYLLAYHVPPMSSSVSYIVRSRFLRYCRNLRVMRVSTMSKPSNIDYDDPMPAKMPLRPAPITTTLSGRYSSMGKVPISNEGSAWVAVFSTGGRESVRLAVSSELPAGGIISDSPGK